MKTINTTEQSSNFDNLEKMTSLELVTAINSEDQKVATVIKEQLPVLTNLIDAVYQKMKEGGRLFYIGAGTSGRLGVLDASECPPTFGVSSDLVIGLIAGGDKALRDAVENAEDDTDQAWKDLSEFNISERDVLVGIAASGKTPYVIGGIKEANASGLVTGCIVCNKDSQLAEVSQIPVELVVGPEFVTGSTRMKSGTAQKMALNMLTTSVMIKLGHVQGNKMVDMKLSNDKLVKRGSEMVAEALHIDLSKARTLLLKHGSVRKAINSNSK